MDYGQSKGTYGNFPDPFASPLEKTSNEYGQKYAQAIHGQWGSGEDSSSLLNRRMHEFEKNRDYANGTQDTSIYKSILNSLDPNNGDGTLLNLDWAPVPIVPKFVKVVVNRVLSRKPYPALEAIDPVSKQEKEMQKAKITSTIKNKTEFIQAKQMGLQMELDPETVPDTTEEAEIFLDENIKTSAEIAAQLATALTLDWSDFDENIYRRCVEDLVVCGVGVTKRNNDPNYGITEEYVDPSYFVHSYTDDPNMDDIVYAGHIKRMSIMDLKRMAGSEFTEKEYEEMAKKVMHKSYNDIGKFSSAGNSGNGTKMSYGYDDYLLDVLQFEFKSVDEVFYESKESQFGNVGFYYKGNEYKPVSESVYNRKPYKMDIETIYGGCYIVESGRLFNYGPQKNIPKNVHDISKAKLSYSIAATNIRRMMPKSLVGSVTGFADQLQLTHLKIQQAVAKAKPDGLIIDIEGLENVQLGRGGDLSPLELQDIYEQTGIMYYRSKNPEGGFQNPPIRAIDNQIRNINSYISLYNHYLRMIRDATGVNEVMDASTPKGDALVGVQQQAMAAGNNALYDITNASLILYRKVCADIVKCLQIIPEDSVLYSIYEKAIGKHSMEVLSSFKDLPMYNFGVRVVKAMSDEDRVFLEQNLQASLAQREIDLEDAIAIRQLKDIDQAQKLLIVRRKRRMKQAQAQQQQNMQAQGQANAQASQAASQAKQQEMQMEAQLAAQKMQLQGQVDVQVAQSLHQMNMQLEELKGKMSGGSRSGDQMFREKLETMKDDRKDTRVKKQAVEQSKLISQRKGERAPLADVQSDNDDIQNFLQGMI
tara:strand:+ start:2094 stop:4544 length:2451 start_codon:yes stop_codon:yes gene_type:complete